MEKLKCMNFFFLNFLKLLKIKIIFSPESLGIVPATMFLMFNLIGIYFSRYIQ